MKVTAVLISRERTYPEDVFLNYEFDEVLYGLTEPGVPSGVFTRYELALQARNEHIYVQDDDCVVDIAELARWYDGEHLTNAITAYHLEQYAGSGVTLVGWGCFFPKRLVDFSRWDRHYGREAIPPGEDDRVFTYLAQPHHTKVMPIRHIQRRQAMCQTDGHYTRRRQVFDMLAKLPKE
jgi:hypothetical protein